MGAGTSFRSKNRCLPFPPRKKEYKGAKTGPLYFFFFGGKGKNQFFDLKLVPTSIKNDSESNFFTPQLFLSSFHHNSVSPCVPLTPCKYFKVSSSHCSAALRKQFRPSYPVSVTLISISSMRN